MNNQKKKIITKSKYYLKGEIAGDANLNVLETEIKIRENEYNSKQSKYSIELREIDTHIKNKENEINQVEQITEIIKEKTDELMNTKLELQKLKLEFDSLNEKLRDNRTKNINSKLSEERRKRVKVLESSIEHLHKKVVEQDRIIKNHERDVKIIEKLREEVQQIKRQKIKLVKCMQSEADQYRTWKQQKDKEINRLKNLNLKCKNEMIQKERMFLRKEHVLKRKCEEALAVNKKLKQVNFSNIFISK